jgi:hypothetical protein
MTNLEIKIEIDGLEVFTREYVEGLVRVFLRPGFTVRIDDITIDYEYTGRGWATLTLVAEDGYLNAIDNYVREHG